MLFPLPPSQFNKEICSSFSQVGSTEMLAKLSLVSQKSFLPVDCGLLHLSRSILCFDSRKPYFRWHQFEIWEI